MKTISLICTAMLLAACGGSGSGTSARAPDPEPGLTPVPQGVAVPLAADKIIEPPMVAIPAGSFQWGSAARTINIAAFQLGKYEVTVAQWRQFVVATGFRSQNPGCWKLANATARIESARHTWDAPSVEQNEFHPVTCVSDIDAKAYMSWLQTHTGKAYRLPSEAEWEYAFRGGRTAWYGDATQICRFANVRDSVGIKVIGPLTNTQGNFACSDGAEWTTVVGMYEPNPFGVYDILGNLNEILDDCEHSSYASAPTDGSAWTAGCSSSMKLRRGGNYDTFPFPSGGDRGHYGSGNHSSMEGFRVALVGAVTPVAPATVAFEAELEKARATERTRRQAAAK